MRVLIDTNIVLDFLLQREPFSQDAELLFQAIDVGEVIGYVTATTLTDIFYISRRHTRSIEQARQAVSETLTAMMVCPVDRVVLDSAFNSGVLDFEDAVQIFSAVAQGLAAIVTRDVQGFLNSPIPVLSIQELLQQVRQQNGD
ncbi:MULTISPECIES: type II toxin-antitoxin system VapC family toxin [Leptolyngbya]|uniref:type II toxin-antitoxin system VapC family toxin n=1 Tax=Leptolyngbya TaxID=47251 RepID=UPI0016851427|nr:PIN domain-containing protein [Leptolyngbya sp. UWPOB_LEPTO1]MBD1854138.1 PIN domain-containing protein [Leptolyngbya sp. FACHB-1624]MBN8560899.1 PIN domain-containing protein [Leptolyngbya sp. UWPOB_LEPTO1]